MDTIRYIDLFAGLGGLRIGFEQALAKCNLRGEAVFASEIKKHAIEAYKTNFNHDEVFGDITQIKATEIPDFDYLLAGFRCQAFSAAGKGLGFEDTRGTLFFDVARILKEKNPKGFILENVEGLVTHDRGKTFKIILHTLKELGYTVSYNILDGKDFGLAQSRKRIYIVGNKMPQEIDLDTFSNTSATLSDILENDIPEIKSKFTEKLLSHYDIQDLYGKSIKDKRGGSNNIHSWDIELKGSVSKKQRELLEQILLARRNKKWAPIIGIDWMDGMPLTQEMIETFYQDDNLKEMLDDLVNKGYLKYEYPKKKEGRLRVYDETLTKGYNIVAGKLSFEFSKILSPDDVTPTLVATDVSKLGVPTTTGIRKLTVREGLRLFGFPDDYDLSFLDYTKAFDLLGNTVCIPVVQAIASKLINLTID